VRAEREGNNGVTGEHNSFLFPRPLHIQGKKKTYGACHNPILGYSPKFTFFQNKNKKNKIKAGNMEKAGREINLQFLKEIKDLIVPHYAPK
jgi:hypothetical protein